MNDLTIVDNTKITFTYKNCELNSCTSSTSNQITYSGSLRPQDLKDFFRLNVPTISHSLLSPDLKSQFNLVCDDTNSQYCFKKDKILACKNDYFLNLNASDADSCSTTCASAYPTYLYQKTNSTINTSSQNTNSGYCLGSCHASDDGTIACPTGNLTAANYGSLTCNGSNYTRFSTFCLLNNVTNPITDSVTGSLLYSQAFNSPKIEIDLTANPLTEYHVEFWFNPDIVFLHKIPNATNYYIFWTNSIRIKKDTTNYTTGNVTTNDYNVYNGDNSTAIIPTNSQEIDYKHAQWTKISYSVVKNEYNASNWDVLYYYRNSDNAGYKSFNNTDNPSLSKIIFCTNNCSSYYDDGSWYSGAYKFLKIWNATLLPLDIYRQTERL